MNLLPKISTPLFILLISFSSFTHTVHANEDHDQQKYEHEQDEGHADDHVERTEISIRYIEASGIKSEIAGPQTLVKIDTVFGVISPVQDQVFSMHAAFPSMIEKVLVQVGDRVKKGQILAHLTNIKTLQNHTLKSPSRGEITSRSVNTGDRVDAEEILVISDLSKVWVDMSAFPENIERLQIGQRAKVYDLHDHEKSIGKINYIAPQMSGGHIARARAIIDNNEGHWRPGMHVKADIEIGQYSAAVAIKVNALQTMENQPVIFEREGNRFQVRSIALGEQDEQWVEVISGLKAGNEYVSENSFILKADILKHGASHDH